MSCTEHSISTKYVYGKKKTFQLGPKLFVDNNQLQQTFQENSH